MREHCIGIKQDMIIPASSNSTHNFHEPQQNETGFE